MITFSDVTVQYPGQDAPAVERFSLEAPSGKITVLLGSSGCGKTTLLQCVNQLVAPSSGTVTIDGRDVREEKPTQLRRSIGYVLQHSGLLPHRTVADNIATVLRLNGVKKSESRQRALQAAERVGLGPELMSRFPNQLSGGQQQRVAVARALAPDPSILLMDEPFGAVDPIVRRGLQDQLLALQEDLAKTILLVTHDVTEALTLGDRIALLQKGGKLAQVGSPEELAMEPANSFTERFMGVTRATLGVRRAADGRRFAVDDRGAFVGVLGPNNPGEMGAP
ncbi:MAG TPA: ATP-binding cassette domain-containing protein [Corynebacterium urealyticum]|nr:ATP-binding cassette domain-containing protein [Corynebacterium urealyticum]